MSGTMSQWNECFVLSITEWLKQHSSVEDLDQPENLLSSIEPIAESEFANDSIDSIDISFFWSEKGRATRKSGGESKSDDEEKDKSVEQASNLKDKPWTGSVILLAKRSDVATVLESMAALIERNADEQALTEESENLADRWLQWIKSVSAVMPTDDRPNRINLVHRPQQGKIHPYQLRIGMNSISVGLIYELNTQADQASENKRNTENSGENVVNEPEVRDDEKNGSSSATGSSNLDLLLDVEVDASLRFGAREITIHELLETGPGDVLELDRNIYDPVDLIIGDKIVARGEVVLVNGNFGLRITEVVEPKKCLESVRCLF